MYAYFKTRLHIFIHRLLNMAQTYKGIFWKTAVPQGCPGSTRRLCAENIREILTVLEVAPLSQFLVEKGLLRI